MANWPAMIVSASYRTDIPAHYGDWFRARLKAGYCMVPNPYGGKPYRVDLTPASVGGFVFWTRNITPFYAALDDVARLGIPFMAQYTVTGLPRALEEATLEPDAALKSLADLARRLGSRGVVWRYDPAVISTLTPPGWHLDNFARMADKLAGLVDECVFSFAYAYRKSRRNLDLAAQAGGFSWRDPDASEKEELGAALARLARARNMKATLCAQPEYNVPGMEPAHCIDAERLSDIAGQKIAARTKGNRPGCFCAQSCDIGVYDSCAQGCSYCYAVQNRKTAKDFLARHDPLGESLARGKV